VPKKISNKRFDPNDKADKTTSNWNPNRVRAPPKTAGQLSNDLTDKTQKQNNFD
jgi:hypothetical protein